MATWTSTPITANASVMISASTPAHHGRAHHWHLRRPSCPAITPAPERRVFPHCGRRSRPRLPLANAPAGRPWLAGGTCVAISWEGRCARRRRVVDCRASPPPAVSLQRAPAQPARHRRARCRPAAHRPRATRPHGTHADRDERADVHHHRRRSRLRQPAPVQRHRARGVRRDPHRAPPQLGPRTSTISDPSVEALPSVECPPGWTPDTRVDGCRREQRRRRARRP